MKNEPHYSSSLYFFFSLGFALCVFVSNYFFCFYIHLRHFLLLFFRCDFVHIFEWDVVWKATWNMPTIYTFDFQEAFRRRVFLSFWMLEKMPEFYFLELKPNVSQPVLLLLLYRSLLRPFLSFSRFIFSCCFLFGRRRHLLTIFRPTPHELIYFFLQHFFFSFSSFVPA